VPIVQEAPKPDLGENPASDPRVQIGGNFPPLEERIGMEFRESLLSDRPDFITRMEAAITAVDRAIVLDDKGKPQLVTEDEETLGKAGDLEKILRACDGHISETHKTVKQPYLDGGRAVDAEKNRLTGTITTARSKLRDGMNAFMAKREAERRAEEASKAAEQRAAQEKADRAAREAREAEEAAQRAARDATNDEEREAARLAAADAQAKAEEAIAAAPLAAAAPARAEPIRSDAGSTVSGKTVWNSEVEDFAKAFKAVKSNPKVQEAINTAIAGLVRAGTREIPGVRIWSTVQAVAR
jgi:hypothetical protein